MTFDRTKILTFSTLYPNPAQPRYGLFVEQRLLKMLATGKIEARVVAPVPWFPIKASCFGHYGTFARVPKCHKSNGIEVYHPRHVVFPKVGMSASAFLMFQGVKGTVHQIRNNGFDFDLIDAHYFYPDGVAAVRLGRLFNRPVVVTARGSDVNLLTRFALPRNQILEAARDCAAIITVSEALRTRLIELGARPGKITVLRNGVDLEIFRPIDREATRRKLSVKGPMLLSVGTLDANKGHHLVIEALAALPGAQLFIVGAGSRRRYLERLAIALGVDCRVRFLGCVEQSELARIYSAADVSVLASEREGMPNVVLESLACGTPVVATPVGGIPEIINAPAAGILATERSAQSLTEALRTAMEAPSDRLASRRHAKQFSWEKTIKGQLACFQTMCLSR